MLTVVAEAGLEPRDLRVMSPTSYQLLHSAILCTNVSCVVLVTGLEPVRELPRRILSPLRLPIPPHELAPVMCLAIVALKTNDVKRDFWDFISIYFHKFFTYSFANHTYPVNI